MKTSKDVHPVSEAGGKGYETTDARPSFLFLLAGGLIVLILVVMFVLVGMLKIFDNFRPTAAGPPPPVTAEANVVPPEPRLQTDPQAEYARMIGREDSLLQTYGWVDEKMGIARIPIDTAIAIIAARDLPYREAPQKTQEQGRSGGGRSQP